MRIRNTFATFVCVSSMALGLSSCADSSSNTGPDRASSSTAPGPAADNGPSGLPSTSTTARIASAPTNDGRPVERLSGIVALSALPRWRVSAMERPQIDTGGESLSARQDQALKSTPPDDDQAAFRAVDPAGWVRLAVEIGRLRALNPLRQTRLLAMVSTSMAVVVADNQNVNAEPSPVAADANLDRSRDAPISPAAERYSPTGPADAVAAGGAAFGVMSTLFPADSHRLEAAKQQTIEVALLSGLWSAVDIERSWAMGVAYGSATATASADDGAQIVKPFVQPAGGTWETSPPVFGKPVEPGGADWELWNACSAAAQIPPPPTVGSKEFADAAQQVVDISKTLTDGDRRLAEQWSLGPGSETPPGQFVNVLGDLLGDANIAVEDQVVVLAQLSTAMADTAILVWKEKYRSSLVRPVDVIRKDIDPSWSPILVTPAFPSYPSGHSAFSAVAAALLSLMFPDRTDEIIDTAAAAGDSRVMGGIHYWFDDRFGAELGWEVATNCAQVGMSTKPPGPEALYDALRFDSPA